ncbi:MAG: dinitrogenase iron-molybdenum cofactor biosynthesis protein [Bacteroidales bacterium]|jgi:predicted Fe-Mo cluster-binding NifX family protein|nr:dinitrogenase iron-molybdenum cofactor biosynthesis protein [Bacteroidales bacterium]
MKTVITVTGNTTASPFDKRFGRAAWFCLFDDASGQIEFLENKYANVNGGAGTKVAEMMVELGVQKVISGDFGPKAKDLLEKFEVQMVIVQDDLSVEHLLEKLKS